MGKRRKFPTEYAQVEDLPIKSLIDLDLLREGSSAPTSAAASIPAWTPTSVLGLFAATLHQPQFVYDDSLERRIISECEQRLGRSKMAAARLPEAGMKRKHNVDWTPPAAEDGDDDERVSRISETLSSVSLRNVPLPLPVPV